MADIMVTLQKLANENTAKTFKFNKEEAATSRKWQEQMSATNHQREVKDLIKAGLNPVLSSGGSGATTPTTSSASGVADSAVNAIGNVESSRNSASAIRYSADQSLKAAQAAAAAQRYAADRNYEASKYSADKHYQLGINTNPQGFIIDTANKLGLSNKEILFGGKTNLKSTIDKTIRENPNLVSSGKISNSKVSNFISKLDFTSRRKIDRFLNANGFIGNLKNTGLLIQFLATGKRRYIDQMMPVRNSNSAKSYYQYQ